MDKVWDGPIPINFDAALFGQRVANRRIQEGIMQKDLAVAAGISNNHMSSIENGSVLLASRFSCEFVLLSE